MTKVCDECGKPIGLFGGSWEVNGKTVCSKCEQKIRSGTNEEKTEAAPKIEEKKLKVQCPKCGAQNPRTSKFCNNCGERIQRKNLEMKQNKGKEKIPDIEPRKSNVTDAESVEVNNMDRLTEALGLVTAGDYGLAETLLRDILGTPELPSNARADALGVLGSCYKFAEKNQEAQDLLEKALALGQSEGFVLSDLEWVYADALADAYTPVVNYMVNFGQMEEVNSMVKKLRQLIATYRSHSNFKTIKHQGMVLFFEGAIASREARWDNALARLKQLVCSPYKEYFVSEDLKFVIGLAYNNMGRIYLTQGDYENAVQYLEESLSYYEQNSEDAKNVLKDLTKARSGKQLPSEIQKLLQDIEMGSREKKIDALQEIGRVGKGHLREVHPVLLNTMRREDAQIAWFATTALAELGDQSDETIGNLIANLDSPPCENENIIRYATIQALSNVKNNTQVVDALIRKYQTDQNISVRLASIWALGSIGDESSRKHLEYITTRGEGEELRAAQAALELFGKESFEEIKSKKEQLDKKKNN